jgi:NAD(P)-dependent dehydrogenase (short-subunit alcohol dehydrogenase family)
VAGFDEHPATNTRAPCFLIQAALPSLRESALKSVVNISSSSGTLRLSSQSVCGMIKCALDYLTQSLADDPEEAYRWLKSQMPLGRIGDPDEIARWIALLLSPVLSFLTGVVIPVDGGQVIPHS